MVTIIIPAHNQLDYCRQCLISVQMNTPQPYKLVLVDNGSTDGVGEYFEQVPDAVVVHAGKNLGFAGGVNLGLEHAEGHVLLLNSDTLVPADWLPRLESVFTREEDIGLVGPMSNQVSGIQHIEGLWFDSLDEISAYAGKRAAAHPGELIDVPRLVGFCLLIRDEVLAKVGGLDERFGIGNFEDDDYCRRTVLAGYRLCVAADAFVFHYGSRTFHAMGIVDDSWRALIHDNQQRYQQKWQDASLLREDAAARAALLNEKAKTAYASGDLARAVKLYRQAIQAQPGDPVAYNDLGVVLYTLGEPEKARAYFEHALRLAPDFEDAEENRVRTL